MAKSHCRAYGHVPSKFAVVLNNDYQHIFMVPESMSERPILNPIMVLVSLMPPQGLRRFHLLRPACFCSDLQEVCSPCKGICLSTSPSHSLHHIQPPHIRSGLLSVKLSPTPPMESGSLYEWQAQQLTSSHGPWNSSSGSVKSR